MDLIYDRRTGKDRRATNKGASDSSPVRESSGKVVVKNRLLKGDRRTEGLQLSESDIHDDEFNKYFKQFQKDDSPTVNDNSKEPVEKLEMTDFQVLYRKDAEFTYLAILYTDQQDAASPILFAFRDECDNLDINKMNIPTQVQNIHGSDVRQSYLDRGWDDITQSENGYPWALKSWLAQHMKQDTI